LLNELDVLVCPSHVEPFGRCLIEAMACEKPVVATRVGGIPEVVDDGTTGILVPPNSPELLATAVASLLNDAELSVRMGQAGRARVENHFAADAHVAAVLEVYGEVLGRDGGYFARKASL
jgi:alpha-maltose-1-phosphate synthase